MYISQVSFRRLLAMTAIGAVAAAGVLFSVIPADAHTDPVGCVSTGPSLLLTVYRADGTTPVGGGSVTPGETIKYEAMLTHAGPPQCNYGGGTLSITTPDGATDVTGGLGAATISFGFPFVSAQVSYVVDSAEVGGDGDIDASTTYAGGTSHLGDGDVSPIGATTPAATPYEKLPSEVHTEVHDPAHADITNGSVDQGTTVHDEATVTGSGATPTGDVTIVLYGNGTCDNPPLDGQIYSPIVGGVIESIDYPALAAGSYSFLASYGGDANYNPDVGVCEPFTIDPVLPLEVVKTSRTAYVRDWNWTINKTSTTTNLLLADGESYTVNYTVDVSALASTTLDASGTIAITNPVGNPSATITSVTDVLSVDGAATVTCAPNIFPQVLAPGATLNCTYQIVPGAPTDQDNTATVTTSGSVPGGSDTVAVTFDAPTEIDECVDVTDTLGGVLGQVCAGDGDDDATFNYSKTFGKDTVPPADVALVCGENTTPNTATYLAVDDQNDTAETGNDGHSVTTDVTCDNSCTLTQGYWKTHNDSFKGGAPTDDNWDNITTLAELSGFFTTVNSYPVIGPNVPPFTWFSVFWTAPKGNAYYNLAHQYMAAKLNILNGATAPAAVASAITSAEDFFDSYTPASFAALGKKHALRTQVVGWAGTLGSFNEGTIGPGHCDEQNPL